MGGRVSREDDYFDDFGITDYTANQYDVHERTSHFKERRPITDKNCVAVEAIYMIEALTLVKRMKTMRKPEVAQHLFFRCLDQGEDGGDVLPRKRYQH